MDISTNNFNIRTVRNNYFNWKTWNMRISVNTYSVSSFDSVKKRNKTL